MRRGSIDDQLLQRNRFDAETGRHAELMKLNGYYASLVFQQTSGLIRNTGEPW